MTKTYLIVVGSTYTRSVGRVALRTLWLSAKVSRRCGARRTGTERFDSQRFPLRAELPESVQSDNSHPIRGAETRLSTTGGL